MSCSVAVPVLEAQMVLPAVNEVDGEDQKEALQRCKAGNTSLGRILRPSATIASKSLIYSLGCQLDRLFWRKCDVVSQVAKVNQLMFLTEAGVRLKQGVIKNVIQRISTLEPPPHITVQVMQLDGTTHELDIQPIFFDSIDPDFTSGLHTTVTTVADLKIKIAEACGVLKEYQVLYLDMAKSELPLDPASSHTEHKEEEVNIPLEDQQSVEKLGLKDGDSVVVVIDVHGPYWKQHTRLTNRYKCVVARAYKVMNTFVHGGGSSEAKYRIIKFLRNCRKVLSVLLERRATHKARPMDDLHRIESHVNTVIMPIFEAIQSRMHDTPGLL